MLYIILHLIYMFWIYRYNSGISKQHGEKNIKEVDRCI